MNVKFTIMYDGTKFHGSQKQPNKNAVEDQLQEALKYINIETKLIFSGRTDRDVHATGQVVNCTLPAYWNNLNKLKSILNKSLPNTIYIKDIKKVNDDFHARYSAKKRTYRYILTTEPINPFNNSYITYYPEIDFNLIQKAIKKLIGIHNFEYFSKVGSGNKTYIREIYDIKFYKYKSYYVIKFTANGFLRAQIRLMLGFLLKISDKKLTVDDLILQLNKTKKYTIKPAPPNGLYLSRITY